MFERSAHGTEAVSKRDRWAAGNVVGAVVLVLIVVVLGAVAWPSLVPSASGRCRGMQSEAKGNLKALAAAEAAHRAARGSYVVDVAALGFVPKGAHVRYDYAVVSASADAFVAEARGKEELAGDLWRVDQSGAVVVVDNVCVR